MPKPIPREAGIARRGLIIVLAFALLLVTAGCGSSKSGQRSATKEVTTAEVTDLDGYVCAPAKTKYARCPNNPYYGKTISQAKAAKRAKARAEARAAAAAKAEARRQAAAHAAFVRAANAWHQGYDPAPTDTYGSADPGAYAKWVSGISCAQYVAEYGCWHVQVVVRDGCPSYVGVEANEYQGNAVVSGLLDNNGTGVPPKTPVVFELDATQAGTTANDLKVECN